MQSVMMEVVVMAGDSHEAANAERTGITTRAGHLNKLPAVRECVLPLTIGSKGPKQLVSPLLSNRRVHVQLRAVEVLADRRAEG